MWRKLKTGWLDVGLNLGSLSGWWRAILPSKTARAKQRLEVRLQASNLFHRHHNAAYPRVVVLHHLSLFGGVGDVTPCGLAACLQSLSIGSIELRAC